MKTTVLIIFLLASFGLFAQSLERQVIASGGFQYANSNGSGSATVGQIDYLTIGTTAQLTQGFQQPSTTVIVLNETTIELTFPECLTTESLASMVLNNSLCEGEEPLVSINGELIEAPFELEFSPGLTLFLDYPNDACDVELEINTEPSQDIQACAFFIPNLITPNGDQRNDLWTLQNPDESTYDLTVLSRWGEVVFAEPSFSSESSWDGRDNKGNNLPTGAYFYVLKGEIETFSGTINLLK